MALSKRTPGGPWWTRFSVRGQRVFKSCRTSDKDAAEEFETLLRARYWRQSQLGETVHTWREAVSRLKREAGWRKSTRARNEFALEFFTHIDQVAVGAINADVARAARDFVETTQKPASANRIMAVFRQVLNACVKWGWTTHAPPVPMAHIAEREPANASIEQCQRLIAELPEHLRPPTLYSLLTGMRAGNTRDLTWDRVDLDRGRVTVASAHYKGKRSVGFDLLPEVVELLKTQQGKHATHVFTYKGERIRGYFNTKAFRKARKRAGLERLRWHDLRHTFASWAAIGGASELVLMQLGGWTSTRMPARYAHLRAGDTRQYLIAVGANVASVVSEVIAAERAQVTDAQVVPGRGIEPPTHALRKRKATG